MSTREIYVVGLMKNEADEALEKMSRSISRDKTLFYLNLSQALSLVIVKIIVNDVSMLYE